MWYKFQGLRGEKTEEIGEILNRAKAVGHTTSPKPRPPQVIIDHGYHNPFEIWDFDLLYIHMCFKFH